ncbi:MAG: glutamate--tRNA ligase [Opitutales bacterium]|nr:glutamate--tRNA ligase [Opitutales bacterium]
MSKVRVRFAPSPTGFFHIGSARTALFNWLYAKHTGGTFILRIEDTDQERNREEYLNILKDGMRWLGLDWDEGPDVGGDYGPYFQSERADIYKQYLEILRQKGRAYDKDGAVFFKVSGQKQVLHDAVYGDVERLEEKDFPIFRSNGTPVFHFVNVVDDICMNVTNVIRGQDHLTNTNKHIELFKAFEAPLPQFAHIPLILKSEGQGKMSKRDRGALIEEYQQKNFLPDAVRNYLCMLGWNPKNDKEIMPIEEIISLFDFPGIVKSNARFDERKMAHFNTEHLRGLPEDQFYELALKSAKEAGVYVSDDSQYVSKVFSLCHPKASNMETFPSLVSYFFDDKYCFDGNAKERVFKKGNPIERLKQALDVLKNAEFEHDALYQAISALAQEYGVKATEYFPIIRFAVSGQAGGADLFPMLEVLGKDRVIARISNYLNLNA